MPPVEIALYGLATMHGLRCDPRLLGWTRLLDEWVVGLIRDARDAAAPAVRWDDPDQTTSTLTEAATRVRSFAYRESEIEPTRLHADGVLRVELQGRAYCVAVDQCWPAAAGEAKSLAPSWLESARARAQRAASDGELAVGAVFVTPHYRPAAAAPARVEAADAFIAAGRAIRCSGCAFSFPQADELEKYRHGSDQHPGALLLVHSFG